jgi:hypothetical protein
MRRLLLLLPVLLILGACAGDRSRGSSEREWARAECDRIIDRDARERCLRRLGDDYGSSREEKESRDAKEKPRR